MTTLKGGHSYCVSLSIPGTLRRPDSELGELFKTPDGGYAPPEEARKILLQELNRGHQVLPFGPPCEGFSYVTGCPGHANQPKAST
jgi:hypothetical protein